MVGAGEYEKGGELLSGVCGAIVCMYGAVRRHCPDRAERQRRGSPEFDGWCVGFSFGISV